MDQVLGNLAGGLTPGPEAPRLLAGTGAEQTHLLSSARPSAACAARSTRRSRASRATTPTASWPRGRRSRSSASARRATTSCAGSSGAQIIDVVDLRSVRTLGFENADAVAQKILDPLRRGRVRRGDPVLLAVQVGDRADPDGAADHPGPDRGGGGTAARGDAAYDYEPGEERDSRPTSCRATSRCRSSARFSKTPPPSRARA